MSNPYPSDQPKRLERSKSNRMLAGVCAGVANYLNMDANLVRVLTVLISLFTGVPIVVYIVLAFVLPEEGADSKPSYPPVRGAEPQQSATGWMSQPTYAPQGSPAAAPFPQAQPAAEPVTDPVWGATGAPWEQPTAAQPAATQPPTSAAAEPVGGQSTQAAEGSVQPPAGEAEATIPITTEPGEESSAPKQEPGQTA